MKKGSHKKSSFGLIFALLALLAIGFAFGREVLVGIIMWIAIFAVAIFLIGVAIVLTYTIKEALEKKQKEKETPHN